MVSPVIPSSAQQSSRLVLCSEGFVEEKQKKNINAIYPVIDWSIRKRLALLITNIEFDDVTMKRKGAEKDEETMEELLKVLGYSVVKHRNLSAQDIDKAVKDFSQHPGLSQTDSVFVVIMSHGKLGAVLGVHWKFSDPEGSRDEFQNDNIFKHLNTQNCPALKDKPKVIIIQACRGEKKGTATWESDGLRDDKTPAMTSDTPSQPATDEEEFEDDALHSVHIEKDFISLLSSTPDNVSYRHSENGSLLIQFIADTINKHAHDLHIEDLFTKVMNCFEGFTQRRQMHSYKALLPFPRPLSAHPASIC